MAGLGRSLWSGATGALLLAGCGAPGDPGHPVGEPPSVVATPLAVLGDEAAGGGVGPYFTLVRSPTGHWLLSYLARHSEILEFSADGRWLRAVGTRGDGPGEFRFIQHLAVSDSLVHVLDVGQARWARLTPALEWVGSTPLAVEGSAWAVLGDTTAVVNVVSMRYGPRGPVVRGFDDRGASVGFGDTLDLTDPLVSAGARRVLTRAPDGRSFWSGYVDRYALERWSNDGVRLQTIERAVSWFPPGTGTYMPTPDEAPPATMVGACEDEEGRLWVAVAVPAEQWRSGIVSSGIREGTGYEFGDRNTVFDTVVEVLDPSTGEVLGRGRFDAALSIVAPRTAAAYYEDERGVPRIELLSLDVAR